MSPDCPAVALHGTRWAYERHGCRCPGAVEKLRAKNRRQQQRGRLLRGPRIRDPWVDEIAVERACRGDLTIVLTIRERAMAVTKLTRRGWSARRIGEVLGLAQRSVIRYRTGEILHGREAA